MIYQIKNEHLKVSVRNTGAELCSIQNAEGKEYLWQGDEATWPDQAPNLFPYVGRMCDKKYRYQGQEYTMNIHGFAMEHTFACEKLREDYLVCTLEDNEDTRAIYPFAFRLEIHYELQETSIYITYIVKNKEGKEMYFGIGGHPGFLVPLEAGEKFEDYYLKFPGDVKPEKVGINNRGFLEGEAVVLALDKENCLWLQHNLFDQDAIVLENMGTQVELCTSKGPVLAVRYPQMTYLGIWQWPGVDVPYICIEPWSSLPSRQGVIEDLEKKPDLVTLEPYGTYRNRWEIFLY